MSSRIVFLLEVIPSLEGDSTAVVKLKDKAGWKKEKPLITQIDSAGDSQYYYKGI